jgi:hypothetical protein
MLRGIQPLYGHRLAALDDTTIVVNATREDIGGEARRGVAHLGGIKELRRKGGESA